MKKIIGFILVFVFSFNFLNVTTIHANTENKELSREAIFIYIGEEILKEIPKSYKYIKLNFLDVKQGTKLYESLQKMVYINSISNLKTKINKEKKLNAFYFYIIIKNITGIEFINEKNIKVLKNRNTSLYDLKFTKSIINNINLNYKKGIDKIEIKDDDFLKEFDTNLEKNKFQIFLDVYKTLLQEHLDSDSFDKQKIIYSAIEGLTKGTDDQFSTFFPPSESKGFNESLSGEFEGIGAYVDMETPGILKIISPISGFPAEKAGLKSGDIILKVNGTLIDKKMSLQDAVNLIKGPAGTKVKLTILRENKEFELEIIRAKIVLKDVEYKVIDNKFFYIKIRMFGDKVFEEFSKSIEELKKSNVKKIILDLRNNPGGYLDSVIDILSLFIEKQAPIAVIKYKTGDLYYNSFGYNKLNLNDYEIYILANSGTASASEIMIGTLKDYFSNLKIIGEKTYGKGSVQTVKSYYDGSSLKYTIAKWYTGKTQTGIDQVGINPDIEVKLDEELFKSGKDNQLDYILKNY